MIDRHYGHLARDGREHAISCSTCSPALSPTSTRWDAAWTSNTFSDVNSDTGEGG